MSDRKSHDLNAAVLNGAVLNGAAQWRAASPVDAVQWLASVDVPWWIAGGWALDLFAGQQSRGHADLDVGIFRRDAERFLHALPSWEFFEASRGALSPLSAGTAPEVNVNGMWGRLCGTSSWVLEVLLDTSDGEFWVFRRNPRIRRLRREILRRTAEGIPYLAPEIQLLYKAKALRPRDREDFVRFAPLLDPGARSWLTEALLTAHPGHEWLEVLQ